MSALPKINALGEVAADAVLLREKLKAVQGRKTIHELAQDPAWAIASQAVKELAEVFGWECH